MGKLKVKHRGPIVFILLLFTWIPLPGWTQNMNTSGSENNISADSVLNQDRVVDSDYEDLMRQIYGEKKEKAKKQQVPIDEPGKVPLSRGIMKEGFLHGSNLIINFSSPYAASNTLHSWYSYVDWGIAMKMPYVTEVESIPLHFTAEISSFKFENTFPQGGTFQGIAYIMRASALWSHAGFDVGMGFWDRSLGGLMDLAYTFRPTRNFFWRLGTRGVLITDVESLGSTWWLDLRISLGLEL